MSGTTFERSGFQAMIADMEAGRLGVIIVKELSRLGREYIQSGQYMELIFPVYGVRFIAVNNGVDSDDPNTIEVTPLLNIMNHFDAIRICYANPEARNGGATEPQIQSHSFLTPFFPPYGMERKTAQTPCPRPRRRTIHPEKRASRRFPFLGKNAKSQKTKSRSFFSRPARPRSGCLSSRPFRQSYPPFQCPSPFLTQKSYNNLTPTGGHLRLQSGREYATLRLRIPGSAERAGRIPGGVESASNGFGKRGENV